MSEEHPDGAGGVAAAMAATPRVDFLPRGQRRHAALDRPLDIGLGQTSSQPSTVRRMLELLEVRPGHRVLDVGAGSGWTTALLGRLVGPQGAVIGVELEPELLAWGRANLAAAGPAWARVEQAEPGRLGWPDEAPYDRVLVSAQGSALPEDLLAQLVDDGVMVAPVRGELLRVRTRADAPPSVERLGSYRFVPLR